MALSAVAAVVGKGRTSAGIAQFLVKRSDSFLCVVLWEDCNRSRSSACVCGVLYGRDYERNKYLGELHCREVFARKVVLIHQQMHSSRRGMCKRVD